MTMRADQQIAVLAQRLEADGLVLAHEHGAYHGDGDAGWLAWRHFVEVAALSIDVPFTHAGRTVRPRAEEDGLTSDIGWDVALYDERATLHADDAGEDGVLTLAFARTTALVDDDDELVDDIVLRLVLVLEPDPDAPATAPEQIRGAGGPAMDGGADEWDGAQVWARRVEASPAFQAARMHRRVRRYLVSQRYA